MNHHGTIRLSLRIGACCVVLGLALNCAQTAQAGRLSPPLPCYAPPQEAAIAFFEFIEAPSSGPEVLSKAAKILFSESLLKREKLDAVLRVVDSAKETYGIDSFDRPLSERLAGVRVDPQKLVPEVGVQVEVGLFALSSRGKVEQRVTLRCEEDKVWKVLSFSYGPPKY